MMTEATDTPVTGIILAGGQSRRMGQNKALMRLGDDPLIAHVIRQMESVTDELLLITNEPDLYTTLKLPMYADITTGHGRIGRTPHRTDLRHKQLCDLCRLRYAAATTEPSVSSDHPPR